MDSIVISGISGRFPGCDNTEELQKALIEGRDLVSDNHGRWPKDFYGLTNRGGIMNDIEKFDNEFFGVPPRQGDGLDPRTRLLMETTLEAIIDAGVHPMDIRGTRTGVFIGMTTSRGNDSVFENKINYTRLGRSMAMTSGMVSFLFDLRGPSYSLDTACSSSLYAFCQAFRAIKGGECDAAIVCGATIILDPYDSLEYKTMNILSPTGKCKFLDEERDGFVKSESVVVTYLQKSKDAKRIYATVKGCGTNTDGFKIEGVTKPSSEMQRKLMEDIYEVFGIDPLDITYMEAHGTGTKIGDVEETKAIADILCKDREDPLLIGSVKTNIGHTEMSSGVTSIIKVILSMEHGIIPPILHLNKVGEDLLPVLEGKLKAVTEPTPWSSGLIGVNSFGVGGTNAHVVLEPNLKTKPPLAESFDCRLVLLAGRNETGLEKIKKLLNDHKQNIELISMLDCIFCKPIRLYNYRGFVILDKEEVIEKSEKVTKDGRQTWFIYSGIGSQWPHMGRDLMQIDYFQQCMKECAQVLSPFNIDLIEIITNGDEEVFKNVMHCFIAIVAVSISLTDFLNLLGIEPDGMIGHSVGEVCCAYADGVISKREAMLIAHARGVALQTAPSIDGTLAVVGLTADEANEILPDDVSIACYNCIDNLTISGPTKLINEIVDQLKADGKFAEVIKGANMAYHSKHIAKAGDILFELLKKIIVDCKPCSEKWISSSVKYEEPTSNDENTDEIEKPEIDNEIIHNPEYHRNNLVNSVHFESAMKKVPQDAIVIEISPKGLLQTIIRRNLGTEAKIVGLSSDTSKDNRQHLFSKIGELFLAGQNPNILKLYDNSKYFPVSRSTPSLAPLVEWERSMKCKVSYYSPEKSFGESIAVDLMDPTMKYLEGHVVDGRIIYPVMGYAFLAWEIFARLHKKPVSEVPVVISSLKIRRMTLLIKDESVIFNVNILTSNGDFEIAEGGQVVCIGNIKILGKPDNQFSIIPQLESKDFPLMNRDDVYYKLRRIGFQYQNHFQGISECKGSTGRLKWCDYWIPFLDSAIHYTAATSTAKGIYLPESIEKILIDPESHIKLTTELENEIPLKYDMVTNVIQCGKVEIRGLQLIQLPEKRSLSKPKLEKCHFIPYNFSPTLDLYECIHLVIQIVFDNMKEFSTFRVLELYDKKPEEQEENKEEKEKEEDTDTSEKKEKTLPDILKTVLSEEIFVKTTHDRLENLKDSTKWEEYDLVIIDKDLRNGLLKDLSDSFFLLRESDYVNENTLKNLNYAIVSHYYTDVGSFFLIKKKIILPENITVINIKTNTFDWVDELKESLKTAAETSNRIYLLNQNQETCGIMGLFKCLRYEDGGTWIRMISIIGKNSEKFSLDSKFYKDQLEKDLSVNIYKNSSWGSYKYFNYTKKAMKESEKCHAEVVVPGDITQIQMVESSPYIKHQKGDIYVYYAGMNFKDVLIAGGILRLPGLDKNNFEIGYEFSGRKSDGQRVFGINKYHCFATTIDVDFPLIRVPDDWTLEEAASVPIIYLTLYYAFRYKCQLESGKSILIHSASGGVGLAAIQMALDKKCTIFATVGSEAKKDALLELFPELDANNIFNSREDSFEIEILRRTNGNGVDYVLNSLIGDLFNASMKCVAINGNFIEIGKTEFLLNSKVESSMFLKNTSLHGISIDELLAEEKRLEYFLLELEKELQKGNIKPIPRRKVFDIEDITEAFKYFQTTNHVGKIILKVREEEDSPICTPSFKSLKAIPKLNFNPDKSYIIVGGLGGLGLEFAVMLSLRGAKHIILNSRSEPKHGYQLNLIKTIESWGTAVYMNHDDCSNLDNARNLLNKAIAIAPVGGIFNMAMVNKDASLADQTIENFIEVYKPKGCITENLDVLSRKLCPKLEHFVVYSSITCGKGNLGQTNYGYANSTMERIIEKRNDEKLPGLAIQWGPIADVGYFARTSKKEGVGYYVAQPVVSYYDVLQEFLLNSSGILASSLLRDVIQTIQIGDSLLESLMKLFGITNPEKLSDETTLLELGMDSLMGFEIKQYLYREHDVDITVNELRNKTIKDIKEIDEKRKNNAL